MVKVHSWHHEWKWRKWTWLQGGLLCFCAVCVYTVWISYEVRLYVGKKIRVEHMQTFSNDWCQFESAQPHLASLVILKHFFTQKSLFPKILKIKHNLRGRWGSPNATSTTVPVYHKASFMATRTSHITSLFYFSLSNTRGSVPTAMSHPW